MLAPGCNCGLLPNGTDLRLVGSAHPTVYQHFQRSQFAYVSAIGLLPLSLSQGGCSGDRHQ
ncbi:MAG: hypothetical protein F6K30_11085 [Cyanothece sp. SIO2G6]|nr:hypothetical protein [Cyanothece sp. SIO2G6]